VTGNTTKQYHHWFSTSPHIFHCTRK